MFEMFDECLTFFKQQKPAQRRQFLPVSGPMFECLTFSYFSPNPHKRQTFKHLPKTRATTPLFLFETASNIVKHVKQVYGGKYHDSTAN